MDDEAIRRAFHQIAAGQVVDLGSFQEYLDDDEDLDDNWEPEDDPGWPGGHNEDIFRDEER